MVRLEVGLYFVSGLIALIAVRAGLARSVLGAILVVGGALFCFKRSYGFTALLAFGLGALLQTVVSLDKLARVPLILELIAKTGDYSYTLYLVHMPIVLLAASYIGSDSLLSLAACVLGANIFAALAARFVEQSDVFAAVMRRLINSVAIKPAI